MGTIEIILISLFIRNIGVYGNQYVPESYVKSFFPVGEIVDHFDAGLYERKLMESGLFQSVQVHYIGSDTIDVIIAVKEVKRFSISPISSVSQTNKLSTGIKVKDRFFLGKMYGLTCELRPFYDPGAAVSLEYYQIPINLLIKVEFRNFNDIFHSMIRESDFLLGFLVRSGTYVLNTFMGPVILSKNRIDKRTVFRLEGNLSIRTGVYKSSFDVLSDLLSDEIFFSLKWMSFAVLPYKFFFFIPEFRVFLQAGSIPQYRKIVAGGYNTIISYPFGAAVGSSAWFFKISLLYPLLISDSKPGFGISWFTEFGNSFDTFEGLINSKIMLGSGLAVTTFSFTSNELGIFISYNLDHQTMYGIYFNIQ